MNIALPWWLKITSKIILARLPLPYGVWQRLGLFRHGQMDRTNYVLGLFNTHLSRAGGGDGSLRGKTILELGPGDSIATALVAASHGAKAILVDAGRFAHEDTRAYQQLALALQQQGLQPPDLSAAQSLDDVLAACHAHYLTGGLASLQGLPDNSVDLMFSHAVLEHVRAREFVATLQECYRVLVVGGCSSHNVDLKDHLANSLNHLRFSQKTWESGLFANSGFYTNRIPYPAMLALFRQAGFGVNLHSIQYWPTLPVPRQSLDAEFRRFSDDDLRVSEFDVILCKGQ